MKCGSPHVSQRGCGIPIETCAFWAPACAIDLFNVALFNLTDDTERDDHCARIYNKSLLYLVSNAFEERPRIPLFRDGEPMLGMDKFVSKDRALKDLFGRRFAACIKAPNQKVDGSEDASRARCHGDFDDDKATVKATLARILTRKGVRTAMSFPRSRSSARNLRKRMG